MGRKGKELSLEKSRIAALFDAGYKKVDIVWLTVIKQSTVYSLLKRYEERGDLENKRRSGRQTEFIDRDSRFQCLLASKISLCLPAGQSVNKKTCLLYYRKLQYFFQNALFSLDKNGAASKQNTCCGDTRKNRLCIQARATKYPPRKTTLVYSFICFFFSLIIFEKVILKEKSECNYKG